MFFELQRFNVQVDVRIVCTRFSLKIGGSDFDCMGKFNCCLLKDIRCSFLSIPNQIGLGCVLVIAAIVLLLLTLFFNFIEIQGAER